MSIEFWRKKPVTLGLFTYKVVIMHKSNRKTYSQICKASESTSCMKFPGKEDNSKMYPNKESK